MKEINLKLQYACPLYEREHVLDLDDGNIQFTVTD